MSTELRKIPINKIRENPDVWRIVNRTTEQYIGLVDSIRLRGVMNAISVREIKDPETKETLYGLIDGLHRFTAAKDAGLTEIPAQVMSLNNAEVLEAQILANVHKIETRPVEYSKQLSKILQGNPLLTTIELANKLAKSPAWLSERLGLTKLPEPVAELVDDGKINLSNGYALAKLASVAPDEVNNFIDRAMTQTPSEFMPTVNTRVKEIRDAKRKGRSVHPAEFTPTAYLRKLSEMKEERSSLKECDALVKLLKLKDPKQVWQTCLDWMMHLDPRSIEIAKQKDDQRKRELRDAKDKRDKERAEQKAKDAAEKAVALQEEARKLVSAS